MPLRIISGEISEHERGGKNGKAFLATIIGLQFQYRVETMVSTARSITASELEGRKQAVMLIA